MTSKHDNRHGDLDFMTFQMFLFAFMVPVTLADEDIRTNVDDIVVSSEDVGSADTAESEELATLTVLPGTVLEKFSEVLLGMQIKVEVFTKHLLEENEQLRKQQEDLEKQEKQNTQLLEDLKASAVNQ